MRSNDAWILGALLLVWAYGRRTHTISPTPSPRKNPEPRRPRPALPQTQVPPTRDTDADLFDPPRDGSKEEERWLKYVFDRNRPGPQLSDADRQTTQATRKLTAFERWIMEPYFGSVPEDLERVIQNGTHHLDLPKEFWSGPLPADWVVPDSIYAATGENQQIWFPRPTPLWPRWWLGCLAHELTHAAQMRMGSTPKQAIDSILKYGYRDSPIERQARWMQRRVLDGLDELVNAYYG